MKIGVVNPVPVQRPIPIWMGDESEVVQRRMARIAVHTGGLDLAKPADHVATLRRFREATGLK